MKRTPRGFALYTEFRVGDVKVRLQRSSASGKRRAWLFVDFVDHAGKSLGHHRVDSRAPGGIDVATPQLDQRQARWLAMALLKFADGAE